MTATKKFYTVPVDKIKIEDRRRKDPGNIDELADSISRYGLLHPVIITRDLKLIAGERRLRAHMKLKIKEIPVQLFEELDEYTHEAVELEENIRRLDFSWQEQCLAILKYHRHRRKKDQDWDPSCTSDTLNLSETQVRRAIAVGTELEGPNASKYSGADSIYSAYNILARENKREEEVEAIAFLSTPIKPVAKSDVPAPGEVHTPYQKLVSSARNSVFSCSFQEYVEKDWDQKQFSVVHCDFPYGIGHDESDQGNVAARPGEEYADTPDIFWGLCEFLAKQIPVILQPKAHIFFWYPVAQYTEIVEYWKRQGLWVDPVPYIWYKSDNTGILPDRLRTARRVYESALLMSVGDRQLSKPISNVFAFPSRKAEARHPSEKPFEVVKHFLSSICDQHTRMLDPTCGAGSALAAAETLGAAVAGCEMNPTHVSTARQWLVKVRSGV